MKLHHNAADLSGSKFGRLTALEWTGRRERNALVWKFQCDCGNVVERVGVEVVRGRCHSCGCLAAEVSANSLEKYARPARVIASTTHGQSRTLTFYTWGGIKDRCLNPKNKNFAAYGDRGIKICQRWTDSFENFLADMGPKPKGKTIDRIDVNGNYEPNNCRWATPKTQGRNRRNNVTLTHGGRTATIAEWSEITGIGSKTIAYRLRSGWSDEEALTKPTDHSNGWNNGKRKRKQ